MVLSMRIYFFYEYCMMVQLPGDARHLYVPSLVVKSHDTKIQHPAASEPFVILYPDYILKHSTSRNYGQETDLSRTGRR